MSAVDSLVQLSVPVLAVVGLSASFLVVSTTIGYILVANVRAYAVFSVCGVEMADKILNPATQWGWRIWVQFIDN